MHSISISDFVTFEDRTLSQKWSRRKVPMSDVYEAYIESRIDIPEHRWQGFFRARHETMSFTLTSSHLKWAAKNFIPEVMIPLARSGPAHRRRSLQPRQ